MIILKKDELNTVKESFIQLSLYKLDTEYLFCRAFKV